MDIGWIKIHRKLLDWEWYKDVNTFKLFLHLLIKANIEDKKWQGHIILRGQLITSTKSLSNETGLSEKQVRIAIKKLEKTNEVGKQTTSHNTTLTVINYDLYQDKGKPKGKAGANEGQSEGKAGATTKESYKEEQEYKEQKNNGEGKLKFADTQKGAVENLKKHDLILWIESQAPRVQKLKNPITEEQAVRIVSKLEPELIKEIFYAMNNYKPLLSKYVDANQTFINWVKIRKEKSKGVTNVHSERSLKLLEIYVSEFNSFFKKQFDWQMYKHLCHRLEEIIKIKGLANCPKLFEKASKAIKKDDFHNRNGFMNVTPEYILRNDIFEKYLNQ